MVDEKPRTERCSEQAIDLRDPYSVRHWARAFRLSELDLAIAVHTAGPRPGAVALLLRREPKPTFQAPQSFFKDSWSSLRRGR